MDKKILFLLLSGILFFSCDDKKITFTENHIQKETENCKDNCCAVADISYLTCKGNSLFAENFNKKITSNIISFINDEENPETIERAIEIYLQSYKDTYDDILNTGQELILSDSISYQDKKIISLKSERYSYTGGAHGLPQTLYYNFNALNGEIITEDELFTDKEKITEVAEKYFKKEQNIQAEQSYDEVGFWFEDGFQLPENIGFTKNEMILHYNPYEIAPYAMGSIFIHIPISEIKQWLTFFK